MNKFLYISLFCFSFCFGQNQIENYSKFEKLNLLWGDYHYLNNNFSKAITYYSKIKLDLPIESQRNLASAYQNLNDLASSKDVYDKITKSNNVSVEDYYKFANLLSNEFFIDDSGRIKKLAKEYRDKAFNLPFEKYSLFEDDSLLFKKRFSPSSHELTNLKSNSIYSDFGGIIVSKKASSKKKTLIFSSKQQVDLRKISRKKRKRIESDLPIYNLFKTPFNSQTFSTGNIEAYPEPINSFFQEGPATYDIKNDMLYFTRSAQKIDSNNKVQLNLYSIELNSKKKIIPIPLPFNIDGYSTMHPTISSDNKIYFSSDRPGGYGGMDLYYVKVLNEGFSSPVNLGPDINTYKDEVFPFIYKEKYLFFTSDGRENIGKLDIFLAQVIIENRWKVFLLGDKYNSPEDDFSFFMSEEQNYGFISSNRENGKGDDDIYAFKFSPKIMGEEDEYLFSNNDTLTVALNGVMVNDNKNMLEFDPLHLLINKRVSIIDSVKNGSIKFNENGTFLYKSNNYLVEKDSFSYKINSKYGESDPINVYLKREELKLNYNEEDFLPIFYDFDKSNVLSKYKERLDKIVSILNENINLNLEVSSYADCRGTKKYNLKLSKSRNNSVMEYLKKRIKFPERIIGKGLGEINNSLNSNCNCCNISEDVHQLNRRTEFKLIN